MIPHFGRVAVLDSQRQSRVHSPFASGTRLLKRIYRYWCPKVKHCSRKTKFRVMRNWQFDFWKLLQMGNRSCSEAANILRISTFKCCVQGFLTWPTQTLQLVLQSRHLNLEWSSPDGASDDSLKHVWYMTRRKNKLCEIIQLWFIGTMNDFVIEPMKLFCNTDYSSQLH